MIKGKFVGLRAVEKYDLELLRDWRNKTDFRRNFREVRELSLTDQEDWLKYLQSTKDRNFMFTIVDLKTNNPIGACGLLYINWNIRSADFSFYLGNEDIYIGDDEISIDSVSLLIDYGFKNLNLNKIWMELYEFDTKKINFFTKHFKFKQDALLRDNCFEDGKYWNSVIISLINRER